MNTKIGATITASTNSQGVTLVSLNLALQCGQFIENGFEYFWKFSSVIELPQFGQGSDESIVMIFPLIKASIYFIILIVIHIVMGTLFHIFYN